MARRKSRPSRPAGRLRVVGIAWYDPVQWAKLKQVAVDADRLDDTHETWLRNAQNVERQLAASGLVLRRVPIDVDVMVEWCRAHNKPVNGAARAEYTSLLASGAGS